MSEIATVKAHAIAVPLVRKHRTAQEPREDVTLVLVEVRTDDGLVGLGQISSTPMKEICTWVDRFAEHVVGLDALATTQVWETMFALTAPSPGKGGLSRQARP